MSNRLTRQQASAYIGCSLSTLDKLQREGYLEGTYLELYNRRYYFTAKLDEWMLKGGTNNGKTN
ncbi:MAG: hypothetical protein IKZ35_01290 [Clostridia bacterium]|nr:hypothetical protein [Clostridia bacterium]